MVRIDTDLLPKVRRLHIGKNNLIIKNRKDVKKIPLEWDFEIQGYFLAFLGYWFEKGYYDDQSVVLACGKDLPGLIQIFDYVSELFQCNYRIKKYQVVYFDSALLKYAMFGLGFPNLPHGSRLIPGWVTTLPNHLTKNFLRGLLTGCCRIYDDGMICVTSAYELVEEKLPVTFATPINKVPGIRIEIPVTSFGAFRQYVGFLSEHKNNKLERILFYNEL